MPSTRHQRDAGLVCAARHGREFYVELGKRSRSLNTYGDSDAARRLRASDIRRGSVMSDAEWNTLMDSRERSFGLAAGTLRRREVSR